VSELERPRSAMPPFSPAARPDVFLDVEQVDPPEAGETPRPFQRDGLPAGFRMRHDAHYVDQLTGRAGAPQVRLIPLGDIDASKTVDAGETGLLARSIARHGVLQPLLVRPRAGRFELIAGARRLAAAAAAGLSEVPCVVHHADEQRARMLAEAESLRHIDPIELPPPSPADNSATWLAELWQSCSAIGSCLHLLGERDAALRDRVALDLVRTEVHRATRLVRCLSALTADVPLAVVHVSLVAALDQALDGFAAERRLAGVSIGVERGEGPFEVRADPDWLAAALSAAVGGMLAFVQTARTPALVVRVGRSSARAVTLDITQQAVSVPAWAIGRFFDPAWTDRPGGYQAGVELAAARKLAEHHGGSAEVVTADHGGCRLALHFPAA
jgi:signal transduction histidine kinase